VCVCVCVSALVVCMVCVLSVACEAESLPHKQLVGEHGVPLRSKRSQSFGWRLGFKTTTPPRSTTVKMKSKVLVATSV
jgi:hypothetical protein